MQTFNTLGLVVFAIVTIACGSGGRKEPVDELGIDPKPKPAATSVSDTGPQEPKRDEQKQPDAKPEPKAEPKPDYVFPPLKSVQYTNQRVFKKVVGVCLTETTMENFVDAVKTDADAVLVNYVNAGLMYLVDAGDRVRIEKHHPKLRRCYVFIMDGKHAGKYGWMLSSECGGYSVSERETKRKEDEENRAKIQEAARKEAERKAEAEKRREEEAKTVKPKTIDPSYTEGDAVFVKNEKTFATLDKPTLIALREGKSHNIRLVATVKMNDSGKVVYVSGDYLRIDFEVQKGIWLHKVDVTVK